jgi:hypothetical protein
MAQKKKREGSFPTSLPYGFSIDESRPYNKIEKLLVVL